MIILIHQNAQKVVKVLKGDIEMKISATPCTKAFWELAEKFPEEIIIWCEEECFTYFHPDALAVIFHHQLIMASYSVKTTFLSDSIGYIDQLPFININRFVLYPTWRMSTDVGGIKGKVLLEFKEAFKDVRDFSFLLNSIAKLGQQNGLFCYSAPQLINLDFRQQSEFKKINTPTENVEIFSFVFAHYKTIRLFLLFWCYVKYERSFPVLFLFKALFRKKHFKSNIDLSGIELKSGKPIMKGSTIDVIIPTLGRSDYLLQVLEDLKVQTLLPKKVIVIEQNPDKDTQSELRELQSKTWPFEIVHHFIHQTGACNARNIALEEIDAEWIFFADDDIRLCPNLLEESMKELKRLGVSCLNINCKKKGEETIFPKIKQWGSFASGTSIVQSDYCKKNNFDTVYEFGYGEDKDFGMQLRNSGCDIIYHPNIEVLHLKAPVGGFRHRNILPWEQDKPKPSPSLIVFGKKYYTKEQLRGFKTELFLRYYSKQDIKNPVKYIKSMKERWRKSEEWACRLIKMKDRSTISKSV